MQGKHHLLTGYWVGAHPPSRWGKECGIKKTHCLLTRRYCQKRVSSPAAYTSFEHPASRVAFMFKNIHWFILILENFKVVIVTCKIPTSFSTVSSSPSVFPGFLSQAVDPSLSKITHPQTPGIQSLQSFWSLFKCLLAWKTFLFRLCHSSLNI